MDLTLIVDELDEQIFWTEWWRWLQTNRISFGSVYVFADRSIDPGVREKFTAFRVGESIENMDRVGTIYQQVQNAAWCCWSMRTGELQWQATRALHFQIFKVDVQDDEVINIKHSCGQNWCG